MMVESHEKRVEPNAEHDKEVHERVENEERQELKKKQLWACVESLHFVIGHVSPLTI